MLETITHPSPTMGIALPGGHYSHAVRSGDLVFISGQLGARADGSHTADLPFEDQVRQSIANLRAALGLTVAKLTEVV